MLPPDPVGPEIDAHVLAGAMRAAVIIVAWGALGGLLDRDRQVTSCLQRAGCRLYCLGQTRGGRPRHPLYLPTDVPLRSYPIA